MSDRDAIGYEAPARVNCPRRASDAPFIAGLCILGGFYVFLIVVMLLADMAFTSPGHLLDAFRSPNIRYAIKLSMISCTITMLLSLWIAIPIGYLMSRYRFWGKQLVDAILDIPIVLPPLVMGLSLLILFQTPPGRWIEHITHDRMGLVVCYMLLPLTAAVIGYAAARIFASPLPAFIAAVAVLSAALSSLLLTNAGLRIESATQQRLGTWITFAAPSVIIAQFSVACAFSVRTMRVTFDQISPRSEAVALTLGCTRGQAFWMVVLPEARRGILTAATLAWARALGEFGPILIFSGATRMRTEVLSTSVFLELSIGNIEAAVAVSLLMVLAAMIVLIVVRVFGLSSTLDKSV